MTRTPMQDTRQAAAAGTGGKQDRPPMADTGQGKIFPPDSPVEVPNLPAAHPAGNDTGTQENTAPSEDASTESSWADNTRAAPAKKNVRNSNIF